MAKKHKPEEIVAKLRQVDVLISQGIPIADAVRSIGVTEVTYYRWRNEYGGLKCDQVKRLKDLETENAVFRRRNRAVSVVGAACALPINGSTPMTKQISPLRQRMIDDMAFRNMSPNTQKVYAYAVANFANRQWVLGKLL
jgi:putative transposase